ncbi:MAG TPA: hypothetical protein ENJ56_08600, partial [Anaerolineae bacterium]|nr:hypothetical protein [Anaerolineae bacterium]
CVRHPLDVAVSRFFHERALLLDSPQFSLLPDDNALRSHVISFDKNSAKKGDMFSSAELFDQILDMGMEGSVAFEMAAEYDNIHIVCYEDLLSDFCHTVDLLFGFCGLEVDIKLLSMIEEKNCFQRFSGGRMAGTENERVFFRKGISGDHLNYMTQDQIDYAARRILLQCGWYRRYFTLN